ncbi:MAG: hypothetical protein MK096_07130 [Oleiphilaceae bacterium]|nr:hypothetical protein [Oleiphilaceae bacterium]
MSSPHSRKISKSFLKPILLVILANFSALSWAERPPCDGESGYKFTNDRETNPRKGGFVADGAYVSEDAFVAPTAQVCDSATVESNTRIMGKSIIKDEAYIGSHVRVLGNAIISGDASITGKSNKPTVIKGYARISSGTITSGTHGSGVKPETEIIKEKTCEQFSENLTLLEKKLKSLNARGPILGSECERTKNWYYKSYDVCHDRYSDGTSDCDYSGNSINWKSLKRVKREYNQCEQEANQRLKVKVNQVKKEIENKQNEIDQLKC